MNGETHRKPLFWVGSSRKDLREFPEPVKDVMGHALHLAQLGGKHADGKTPLKELNLIRERLKRAGLEYASWNKSSD